MANIDISSSSLGTALQEMLGADEIQPGAAPSYQICKTIYEWHPIGGKLVEKPLEIAYSQKRNITIPKGPETRLKEAFDTEWEEIGADGHIFNVMRLARMYGISSIALMEEGVDTNMPLDLDKIADAHISFNAFDPLNTAGSLVLNQVPTDVDFQHVTDIRVNGKTFHRSRTCVMMNESPIYISYTSSAFGFVGRSVYQRTLYPLKSYIQSLLTDDMVVRKAGVLVAKLEPAGSITDRIQGAFAGLKRQLIKEAATNNVISITPKEAIETLNMMNLDGAYGMARKNILENIASGAAMPAKLLTQETFAEGFGEGAEDAKQIAQYVDGIREKSNPLFRYFDRIVQRRAWGKDFYETIQRDFPEYRRVPYSRAFFDWTNSFNAVWPSLLKEPESEAIKTEEVRGNFIISVLQELIPHLDPANKTRLIECAIDNFNGMPLLITSKMEFDPDAFENFVPPETVEEQEEKLSETLPSNPKLIKWAK